MIAGVVVFFLQLYYYKNIYLTFLFIGASIAF